MRVVSMVISLVFFFFQAEDGIRDYKVTGVQTCALPDLPAGWQPPAGRAARHAPAGPAPAWRSCRCRWPRRAHRPRQIGRASCRGRVEISVVAVSLKKKKGRNRRSCGRYKIRDTNESRVM